MWCSSRNIARKVFTGGSEKNWDRSFGNSRGRRKTCRRGASDGGPRSYAVVDTTEVLGFRGGWVYKREECDRYRAQLHGSSEEFCRAEFLGAGVLRVNSGAG